MRALLPALRESLLALVKLHQKGTAAGWHFDMSGLIHLSPSSRKFSSWQLGRIITNENNMILALSEAVLEWNDGACFRAGRGGRRLAADCRDKAVVYELQVGSANGEWQNSA